MDGFFELESLLQNDLRNREFFYSKLIASEKVKNYWNQKFCKVAHERLVARTWWSDYFYPEK